MPVTSMFELMPACKAAGKGWSHRYKAIEITLTNSDRIRPTNHIWSVAQFQKVAQDLVTHPENKHAWEKRAPTSGVGVREVPERLPADGSNEHCADYEGALINAQANPWSDNVTEYRGYEEARAIQSHECQLWQISYYQTLAHTEQRSLQRYRKRPQSPSPPSS
jgi:hypothetical protein